MPNLGQVMKQEICRLARREAKSLVAKLQKDVVALKKRGAQQRKQIEELLANQKAVFARLPKVDASVQAQPDEAAKFIIQGRGVLSLRKRLGLSQYNFGRLVGVDKKTVMHWEHKAGVLRRVDSSRKAKLMWVKGIGVRQAKELLAEMSKKEATKTKMARKSRRKARK